jgi:hypothetical protein
VKYTNGSIAILCVLQKMLKGNFKQSFGSSSLQESLLLKVQSPMKQDMQAWDTKLQNTIYLSDNELYLFNPRLLSAFEYLSLTGYC